MKFRDVYSLGLTLSCLIANIGCASGQVEVEEGCAGENCASLRYFGGDPLPHPAPCAAVLADQRIGDRLSVGLYFGGGASDNDVAEQGARLARFYRPYELSFETAEGASPAGLDYAMVGSEAELSRALEQADIPAQGDLTPDEQHRANVAVGAVVFAGLRHFIETHPAADANVVVLEHVMSPELELALFGSSNAMIVGFGISPLLFDRASADDPSQDLYEMTNLGDDFAPTLFIGRADFGALPGSPDNIVAHEMGHALGLPHSIEPYNLMTPGQNRDCNEPLSSSQVAQIRFGREASSTPSDELAHTGPDSLPRIVESIVAIQRAR